MNILKKVVEVMLEARNYQKLKDLHSLVPLPNFRSAGKMLIKVATEPEAELCRVVAKLSKQHMMFSSLKFVVLLIYFFPWTCHFKPWKCV